MSGNGLSEYSSGDEVQSSKYGVGRVVIDHGTTVIVRFNHGLEECTKLELVRQVTPEQALYSANWHQPNGVITRAQSESIQSVNNSWGVFSRCLGVSCTPSNLE